MIHEITANKDSFRPVRLVPGLNVILAERTADSSQKDTRNGLGKSMLIEIIHFCLGSNVQKTSGLNSPSLKDWVFTMRMSLAGEAISITRAIATRSKVQVSGLSDRWAETPPAEIFPTKILTVKQWKAVLGKALFGLNSSAEFQYRASARTLVSCFVRRGHFAYGAPFTAFERQPPWSVQVHMAFLLGMEWQHAVEWQAIKDKDQAIKDLRRAINAAVPPEMRGTVGELEAERALMEQAIERDAGALDNFKVHPQYESIQHKADQLTEQLHDATNSLFTESRRLKLYKRASEEEESPSDESVVQVYKEMGIVFSECIRRSLHEAQDFYRLVVRDRRAFLSVEIRRLAALIEENRAKVRELTEARAKHLEVLRDHGALRELTKLQEKHAQKIVELEDVKRQIKERRPMESETRRLAREKTSLLDIATRDHAERHESWDIVVRQFNDNSQALYKAPGRLVIDITDSGFKFGIEISKSGSEGIGKMKIFCLDLALLEFSRKRDLSVNFLVHDSDLYDGVDSRQRAAALELAAEISERSGTQYICALNSDMVPKDDFSESFDIDQYVRHELTDREPSGTLLGIMFDPPVRN